MSDRLQEIRARLDDWKSPWVMDDAATAQRAYSWAEQASADIAWLLDELQQSYWDVDEAIRKGEDAADYWKQQFDSLRRQHKEMRP